MEPPAGDAASSSLIFLGTGCSTVVPDTRCLIRPSSTPPCPICSQALSLPPHRNPNYRCTQSLALKRCNTSLFIDYCDNDGTHSQQPSQMWLAALQSVSCVEAWLRCWLTLPNSVLSVLQFLIIPTHEHADAILGLDDVWMIRPSDGRNDFGQVPVFLTKFTMDSKIPLLCEGDEASQVAQLDWRIIEGDIEKPFISSGLEFVPLPVMHGEGYVCLGFPIWEIMPSFHAAISKSGAGQLDLLILEANSLHGEALDAVKRISPKRALLTGMAHEIKYCKENQNLAEWSSREGIPVQLAHDGLRVFINL
ncbi:hypothetical protein OsI_12782 [Oryza sativa Indica Group]|uniref:Metallo-beta-lactamase domain-containing protein n=1 Tax=Oryza sativa subsp. indica TaxID=39946 RepID=B8AN52_ORYSI|nr:hypothetical protein OsI_12782 [Oryza sativa Indica Group]